MEELLAGYVLLSLTGEDAIEADRLLSEHVPSCPMCRETMAGFQAVSGDLALSADPVPPPELLLPRIRRGMDETAVVRRPRRAAWLVAAVAGVAVLVALGGLSLSLGNRVSKTEDQRGSLVDAIHALGQGDANTIRLTSQSASHANADLVGISGPTLERLFLVGRDVPVPAPGYAYQLWVGTDGTWVPVGGKFAPENGMVVIEFSVPSSAGFDRVAVTEEPVGSRPTTPGTLRWTASL
jgi:hypothetical protein